MILKSQVLDLFIPVQNTESPKKLKEGATSSKNDRPRAEGAFVIVCVV